MIRSLFGVVFAESNENRGLITMYITQKHAKLDTERLKNPHVRWLSKHFLQANPGSFCISKEAELILLPCTVLSPWDILINKILSCLFQFVKNVSLPVKYQLKKARSKFYETENIPCHFSRNYFTN